MATEHRFTRRAGPTLAVLAIVSVCVAQHPHRRLQDSPTAKGQRKVILPVGIKRTRKPQEPFSGRAKALKELTTKAISFREDERLFDEPDFLLLGIRTGWRLVVKSTVNTDYIATWAYYDPQRVTSRARNIRQAWTRLEERKGLEIVSFSVSLDEYACDQKKTRNIQVAEFTPDGGQSQTYDGDGLWSYIVPETLDERLYGIFCSNELDQEETNMFLAVVYFREARRYEKRREFEQALKAYQEALEYAPNNEKILTAIQRAKTEGKIRPRLPPTN